MHVNFLEWCLDEWSDNYDNVSKDGSPRGNILRDDKIHVLRGGSWLSSPDTCRSAYRYKPQKSDRSDSSFGLQVVCEISRFISRNSF